MRVDFCYLRELGYDWSETGGGNIVILEMSVVI